MCSGDHVRVHNGGFEKRKDRLSERLVNSKVATVAIVRYGSPLNRGEPLWWLAFGGVNGQCWAS
ncbi:hypothetical protein D1821_11540 [Phaeobacter inhibens]|nr:hypothetical protein D1821_11540 [Phaeobacter inhibens]